MRILGHLSRIFSSVEWGWSLALLVIGAIGSFALPAWAVSVMAGLQQFAPLSWVIAGFAGLAFSAFCYSVYASAYRRWVRSRYDRDLYKKSGFVDPMARTFEDKRIYLSEFCLPSDQYIEGKTFVNCEIIGPAVVYLRNDYQALEQKLPVCDAVVFRKGSVYNSIIVDRCSFRGCSFKRITILLSERDYQSSRHLEWLNWLSEPAPEPELPGIAPVGQTES